MATNGSASREQSRTILYTLLLLTKQHYNVFLNAHLKGYRHSASTTVYNGCVYIVAGVGPKSGYYDDIWRFDVGTVTAAVIYYQHY